MNDPVLDSIDITREALEQHHSRRWVVGFSGGKDSTATLKILLSAYKIAKNKPDCFEIIYCDTGVENPILDRYVKNLARNLISEAHQDNLPISFQILSAPIHERFFVKIIGRGYPPPTNNFRWCTKALRIDPVNFYITNNCVGAILALGLRRNESTQRNRSLSSREGSYWQTQKESKNSVDIFMPLLNFDVDNVWDAVFGLSKPKCIKANELEFLYRDASGECPIIKSPQAAPCGSGRFGCWTCTVVRKDKSALKLIESGYRDLMPYLEFRNWLAELRNDHSMRWPKRRNGSDGLGPFTLEARALILKKIDELEDTTRQSILSSEERGVIAPLWRLDHVKRLKFKMT